MLKFTQGWDPGFFGAETFLDGGEPFYCWYDDGIIIVDKGGVAVYEQDGDVSKEYSQRSSIETTFLGEMLVLMLESLTDEQFTPFLEYFKAKSEYQEY